MMYVHVSFVLRHLTTLFLLHRLYNVNGRICKLLIGKYVEESGRGLFKTHSQHSPENTE
jgi:hypothetical protein